MKLEEYLSKYLPGSKLMYRQDNWVVLRYLTFLPLYTLAHYHGNAPGVTRFTGIRDHIYSDYVYQCHICGETPPGNIKLIAYTVYKVRPSLYTRKGDCLYHTG